MVEAELDGWLSSTCGRCYMMQEYCYSGRNEVVWLGTVDAILTYRTAHVVHVHA